MNLFVKHVRLLTEEFYHFRRGGNVFTFVCLSVCDLSMGRGEIGVRCGIAMPEVVSSNPGRGKINLQK